MKLEKLNLPSEIQIESLTHAELISLAKDWRDQLEKYQGILFRFKKKIFGKSSERSSKSTEEAGASAQPVPTDDPSKNPAPRSDTTKQLSERYPNAPIRVENIEFSEPSICPCCGLAMQDSGMSEDSEYLTTEPKEFIIVKQVRRKARCSKCHSAIITAPAPARISPGGSYSDAMIVDAALSKYCDLIPMERYCQMAARNGLHGLPANSLITASIRLSEFLEPVYAQIRMSTLITTVLLADETPHRMLEGDPKSRWYLWGFSTEIACFFECHDTRSGDVSTSVLLESTCEILLTDVYSGYKKSIRLVNEIREKNDQPILLAAYCNAHARRRFKEKDSDNVCDDAESMIKLYEEIYRLNAETKEKEAAVTLAKRAEMRPLFEAMENEAKLKINSYSSSSQMYTAYNYFIKNYEGLTRFLDNHLIPIDNNHSERLLRSPVVGRKTWYGTHSRRAAEAAAVHFTIVESCKMIGVNPREFYMDAVKRIHANMDPLTPFEYQESQNGNTC